MGEGGAGTPRLLQNEDVLGGKIILVCGFVTFVPAVAYHFCLNLPATFSQLPTNIIFQPSIVPQTVGPQRCLRGREHPPSLIDVEVAAKIEVGRRNAE